VLNFRDCEKLRSDFQITFFVCEAHYLRCLSHPGTVSPVLSFKHRGGAPARENFASLRYRSDRSVVGRKLLSQCVLSSTVFAEIFRFLLPLQGLEKSHHPRSLCLCRLAGIGIETGSRKNFARRWRKDHCSSRWASSAGA